MMKGSVVLVGIGFFRAPGTLAPPWPARWRRNLDGQRKAQMLNWHTLRNYGSIDDSKSGK
jgi:hypothetical protein